jgi:hypothetical protein
MSSNEKAQHISQCLQLAILLEVSAEKPGIKLLELKDNLPAFLSFAVPLDA